MAEVTSPERCSDLRHIGTRLCTPRAMIRPIRLRLSASTDPCQVCMPIGERRSDKAKKNMLRKLLLKA